MSYLSSDREVAYQRAGSGKGGGMVWKGRRLGLELELETGAGRRSWELGGGFVAADPFDKRARRMQMGKAPLSRLRMEH